MNLLKTKTFWTGLVTVATGIILVVYENKEQGLQTILGGLGLIFLRQGLVKVTP